MKTPELNWPQGVKTFVAPDAETLAESLAHRVADLLKARLAEAPRASLAVSGGSTPVPFFRVLRRQVLDWTRVDITLADERWVSDNSEDSNTRLVKEHLLREQAASARFFPLKQDAVSARDGQPLCEAALADFTWPLDLLVLGMGADGHTASLFPDAPELPQAMDKSNHHDTIAMTPPSQPQERISLTCRALSGARYTLLHLKGDEKLATLTAAFSEPDRIFEMPIRAFIKPDLEIFWSP
ncbi:MAG: 6-phosphogluconolactonase [Oleiphilaceae bacterium]|nr:6-phosphogluconolactonase [Oleiphilaceae bacterium]